jgi:hypothetical protein
MSQAGSLWPGRCVKAPRSNKDYVPFEYSKCARCRRRFVNDAAVANPSAHARDERSDALLIDPQKGCRVRRTARQQILRVRDVHDHLRKQTEKAKLKERGWPEERSRSDRARRREYRAMHTQTDITGDRET